MTAEQTCQEPPDADELLAGKRVAAELSAEYQRRFAEVDARIAIMYLSTRWRRGLCAEIDGIGQRDDSVLALTWRRRLLGRRWSRVATIGDSAEFLRDQLDRVHFEARQNVRVGNPRRSHGPMVDTLVLLGLAPLIAWGAVARGWLLAALPATIAVSYAVLRVRPNRRPQRRDVTGGTRAILVDGRDVSVYPSAYGAANELCEGGDAGAGYLEDGRTLTFYDGGGRWPVGVHISDDRKEAKLRQILVTELSTRKPSADIQTLTIAQLVDAFESG